MMKTIFAVIFIFLFSISPNPTEKKFGYKKLKTIKLYSVSLSQSSRNKEVTYRVNNDIVSKSVYNKYQKGRHKFARCCPCIIKRYDINNILLSKQVACTDCIVGDYVKYFPNGNIEIEGEYKQNNTKNWKDIYNRGLCSVKDGIWKYYDESGGVVKTENYKDNQLLDEGP